MGSKIFLLPVIGATTFFILLFAFTKIFGPIPFSVKTDTFQAYGEGKALAIPDMATLEIGVFATGNSVKQVKDRIDTTTKRISAAVKDLGIESKDIQTTRYDISPTYDLRENKQTISEYSANTNLSINVRDIDQINSVIDIATRNEANQVYGIKFDISDKTKLQNEARQEAVSEAKNKAEQAAKIAGFRLGKLVNYNEFLESDIMPVPVGLSSDKEIEGLPTPNIEPGSTEVKVTVTLSYEIQ